MDLLIPEIGILVWMLIAAGIVFLILIKWGFPVITKMVDDRKEFIDNSLESAIKANERLANIEIECDQAIESTKAERAKILKETEKYRKKLISEARREAEMEQERMITYAKKVIEREKEEALRSIRFQVAEISLDIAEKVLRKKLSDSKEQTEMIDRLLDDIKISGS
ncbi:MAG TPA: F0F1 ATP synthase subunit B [Bacteroidaceae bacterium]|nr:F0F1 ATP synthase subunit B [Bacteroidaceae bacterium]